MGIRAVGFDIDGTLYPEYLMYVKSSAIVLQNPRLIYHYGRARKLLRNAASAGESFSEGFRTRQARTVLESMGRQVSAEKVTEIKKRISRNIYGKWDRLYASVRAFRDVRACWLELGNMGLKLGLLSDFPLGSKPEALGVGDLSTAFCCAEETGYLKPRPEPFIYLADKLGCRPEEVLYVGNSYEKDIIGARAVGMKTALISRGTLNPGRKYPLADIIFSYYANLPQLLTSYL